MSGKGYILSEQTNNKLRQIIGDRGYGERSRVYPGDRALPIPEFQFFVLAEDLTLAATSVRVFIGKRSGVLITPFTAFPPQTLINIQSCLENSDGDLAKAGLTGLMTRDPSGETYDYIPVAIYGCIEACNNPNGATLSGDPLTDATIGDPYSHSTDSTGIVDDWVAVGLPDGLTMDSFGEITGTVAATVEPQTYYVQIQVTPQGANCPITKLVTIKVEAP